VATLASEYERFVAELIGNIKASHRDISQLGHGRENEIEGVCGQRHQLDVSFVDSSFDNPTLVVIECKRRRKKPIDLEHVKVVKATVDDILEHPQTPNNVKAVIVTTVGARDGAKRYAEYYGIDIQHVPHGPDYTFKYENVVQAGLLIAAKASVIASGAVLRRCPSCAERFEPNGSEAECHKCSS
jgi:hypothetical protein